MAWRWFISAGKPDNSITNLESFEFKSKLIEKTNNRGIINIEIAVSLKFLSNFWRTPEMPLTNCKFNLILTWTENVLLLRRTN